MNRCRMVSVPTLLAVVAVALAGLGGSVRGLQAQSFPHRAHQGLFPVCTGCHEGIPLGTEADYYPEPDSCTGCHDGVREERVDWQEHTDELDNVDYEHRLHDELLASAGDPAQTCAACHIPPGGASMAVGFAVQLRTCWGCHAHEASEHQVDADCTTCHLPLAETGFDQRRVESMPVPLDHDAGAFLDTEHGRLVGERSSRCAICHTRERCVACHVNVELDALSLLPSAPPGMELPPATAHYNAPASHVESGWISSHGLQASRTECATCHTSDDCASCHLEPFPGVIGTLPARAEVAAPGVYVVARPPDTHESLFFLEAHPTLAASSDASCTTCHMESFCVSCHDAPVGGGYHPADFVARHPAEAFGRDVECSNCHSTQVFCRECHVQVGLVGTGRLGPGYHDDGPVWLIRHAQAARQNLESCASCHTQTDCTQCHGVLSSFSVSPHSASFDAERSWARSPRTCLACHVGNPLSGR